MIKEMFSKLKEEGFSEDGLEMAESFFYLREKWTRIFNSWQ